MIEQTIQKPYLEYDDESHTYYADGVEVISNTQVLTAVGAIDTSYFTEEHARRGTLVHAMTERMDAPRKFSAVQLDRYSPEEIEYAGLYLAQWNALRKAVQFEIEPGGVEEMCFDLLHGYATRLDRHVRFAKWPDMPALIEIKTNKSGYVPQWTGLQLSAQGNAKEPGELFYRFVAVLTPERFYLDGDSFPVESFVDDRDTFLAMLRAVRWKQENL